MSVATTIPDMHQLAAAIKGRARELGFDLVGIAPVEPSRYRDYLREWLEGGQGGTMAYLANRFDERTDPTAYLPGAASVICVAMNYHVTLEPRADESRGTSGRVARYALGDDYHAIIKTRLHGLADWIREASGGRTRSAVDTAPVMEKELAARAGVGWLGKNACIINEQAGSWLLLGEILTTLDLPHDRPAVDRCGTCRRCIDACPTGAITAPYQLDARRCISYLTIEHRGEIDSALRAQMGDWLYGCDVCQDVCPWNGKAVEALDPALKPRFADGTLDAREVLEWGDEEYRRNLRRSAMKRVKLPQLKRNARIVLDNSQGG
ncbi:MAG TPA: tRNA epoxyqueuosine(34) reductase QueG [Tepidisphaeraceae bacterium]